MDLAIFKAFNPYYAYSCFSAYPRLGLILGCSVPMVPTGAEALYSDLWTLWSKEYPH